MLQFAKARDGATDVVEPLGALRDEVRHGLVMASNDDPLAFRNAVQKFAEVSLRLELDAPHGESERAAASARLRAEGASARPP